MFYASHSKQTPVVIIRPSFDPRGQLQVIAVLKGREYSDCPAFLRH